MVYGDPDFLAGSGRPWDRGPDRPRGREPGPPRRPFHTLDSIFGFLTVLGLVVGVIAVIAGFAGQGTGAVGVACLAGALSSSLGRVLIFIAQRLDLIEKQGRGPEQGSQ